MQVYQIRNKVNGKSYVGTTIHDFKKRYVNGNWAKYTHSHLLKSAIKKYGESSFEIYILWEGEESDDFRFSLEEKSIKELGSMVPNGYNRVSRGGSKVREKSIRSYQFVYKNGDEFKGKNLSEFCRIKNIDYSSMLMVANGKHLSSQGYARVGTPLDKICDYSELIRLRNVFSNETLEVKRNDKNLSSKLADIGMTKNKFNSICRNGSCSGCGWTLAKNSETRLLKRMRHTGRIMVNKLTGESIFVKNVKKFCKERGLHDGAFYGVLNGKTNEHKGWSLSDEESKTYENKRRQTRVILISSDGSTIEVKNCKEFCRENNLIFRRFLYWIKTQHIKEYFGWILKEDRNIYKKDN